MISRNNKLVFVSTDNCPYWIQVSSGNKTLITFHCTDWFIGILILADYNPHNMSGCSIILCNTLYIKQPTRIWNTTQVN